MISKHLLYVLVFILHSFIVCIPASETYKSILWDPENPLFTVGDANCPYKYKRLKIRSASNIKFVCPNVAIVLQTTSDEVSKTNKYENLWLLFNKESFDKCDTTLDINVTEPVLRCDEPSGLQFQSITFQRYAALKDEPEFKKGHFYYIIATSNGKYSSLNSTSGGRCNDTGKNISMKIEVYVCNNTGQDEMCKEGVGELTCPYDTSSSSSESTPHVTMFTPTATQISTPTTVTTTEKASTTIESEGDSNGNSETAWMATALIFMVICIAIVTTLILYYFCCLRKKKTVQKTGSLPDKENQLCLIDK